MSVKTEARRTKVRAKRAAGRAGSQGRRLIDRIEERLPGPLRTLVERIRKDDILFYSAGLAFYATVSIVPLALLVISLVSLVLGDQRIQQLADQIGKAAPKNLGLDTLIRHVAQIATRTSLVALITALWPATAYGSGLTRAFDELSPARDRPAKGLRGRGLLLLVLLPVFVLGALISSYAGSQALGSSTLSKVLGIGVALVAGFLGAAVGIALIYRIFPPDGLRWHEIVRATAFTAAGITILSLGFTLFLALGSNFEQHYATSGLAAFVLLAVWLFLANALLLVGYRIALESRSR
jgi:membrane protein